MSEVRSEIMGRKIRVALVGCGRIAERHFEAINAYSDDLELVGVCDTDTGRLEKASKKYGAPGFSRLSQLLDASAADVVVLATPSGLHPTQAIEVAEFGRHVITEKPMATRWSDGIEMVDACDKSGVHLFVVKQNRLNPTLQHLKQAVRDKRFGRIFMVVINVFWTRPQSYYDQDDWRGTWEFDGGALMNQASHYVDLLDWLGGPVKSVQAEIATLGRDMQVEDTAVMNVRWRSGALGSVNVTMLTYPKNIEGSITIIGENGTATVGGVAVNEIERWEFADAAAQDDEIKHASYETASVYGFGHHGYYKNVIATLRGQERPYTDGREGLRSLEILIAAYLSARDGKSISLPLEY